MERTDELEMFRTTLRIADLHPDAIALPDDCQVIVGAMRLHYLDWGGSGAPILFLHGGGLTAHTWDCVAVMLRGRYRCVALDQRGHGDSEWSPVVDYRVAAHLGDIEGFIDAMKLDRPILVGQSMGGLNSIAYATRHSDRMRAMVIVDVAPEISASGADRIRDFAATLELDSPEEFLERAVKFNPIRDPAVLRRSLHYNLRETPAGKWMFKHDQRRRTDEAMRSFSDDRARLVSEVSKIKCPTLVVRGALSDILTDEGAEKFARSLPDGRWVRIEKSGHNVQGDNPRALLDAMLKFFRDAGIS
ncbi:MAG: alpha/beta hydrolase [Candidatus Binatus sp.]|uniref:alpha/beta fold hydrolase n=1 Tax=Candidatus Binatus sp. TaxID=2811406 RepID=UPI002719453D|nr:alpha/beta hydrolase [Candidatus Binatus sp.]MDO8432591.1 alpha/beta hydrolase [Candidatus Binatus sp.]